MPEQISSTAAPPAFDVIVVGAGLAGLDALHRLRGMGLRVRVYEAGSGVGGTWFWNRYPGARCDIESLEYSYAFSEELQQEWKWPERYGTQREILRYINHVAERFDLLRDVQLNTRIASAVFGPKPGSTACSGCGIRPTTLPLAFVRPAMSSSEPFGFTPR